MQREDLNKIELETGIDEIWDSIYDPKNSQILLAGKNSGDLNMVIPSKNNKLSKGKNNFRYIFRRPEHLNLIFESNFFYDEEVQN